MPEYKPEFPVDLNPHQRKVFWNRRNVRGVKADKALNVSTKYRHSTSRPTPTSSAEYGPTRRHQFTPEEWQFEQRLYSGENSLEMKEKTIRESKAKRNLEQKYQTKGKKSLLTSQPTKSKGYIQTTKTTSTTSKGGGKSGGGGGGKWGWFNRMRHSPWNLLRNDKSF